MPVFGVGEDGETPYYAMQFIQGQGLDAVLEELKRLCAKEAPASVSASRDGLHGDLPAPGLAATDRGTVAADVARSLWTGKFALPGTETGGCPDAAIDREPEPVEPRHHQRRDRT